MILPKLTLIVTTRCNLKCKLCCEYVPQSKPFPDMTIEQERAILESLFDTVDGVKTLHLSGGGEPFLHSGLADFIDVCMDFSDKFERIMLFTNCTIIPNENLFEVLKKYSEKLVIQVSRYGVNPDREEEVISVLVSTGVKLKIEKYYGENQSFGGWVDFGEWMSYGRTDDELVRTFKDCAVTKDMCGNWRTRDGKVHWCSRSQRGTELGFLTDFSDDYVDVLDKTSREEKREKFRKIATIDYLAACNYCSGNQGTSDRSKRFPAAEQIV